MISSSFIQSYKMCCEISLPYDVFDIFIHYIVTGFGKTRHLRTKINI